MSPTAALARAALLVAGAALVVMTGVVAWAVFGRFVLNDTPAWAEQVAMLLLGWVILGAAAAGVRESVHMGFEPLRDALPGPLARACHAVSDLVVAGFGAGMAWFGAELAIGVWDDTLPTTGLPGGVKYLPIAAGGVLILVFGLERLVLRARGQAMPAAAAHGAEG
ncbi:MAG: TRAP transporter small permease [Rubritepida sp.]|nr:TRAP transporter small permease [Rubritepida sp.]MCU0943867.1 TRAP transporter small permease [Rubritepida sp.]